MASNFGLGDLAAAGLSNLGIGAMNVGNVVDTVDFVKKAWSSFGVPSNFAPTADLDELDRRIADLKAVEHWLTLNLNMLQGTIQAIEIQRITIATLKAYGGAFGLPATQSSTAAAGGGAAQAAEPEEPVERRTEPPRAGGGSDKSSPRASATGTGTGGTSSSPELDPTAWWNLLQEQFNQIAAAAMSGVGMPAIPASESGNAGTPAQRRASSRRRTDNEGPPVASRKSTRSPLSGKTDVPGVQGARSRGRSKG